jgi:hypothetical protein
MVRAILADQFDKNKFKLRDTGSYWKGGLDRTLYLRVSLDSGIL